MNLDSITAFEDSSLFKIEFMQSRSYELDDFTLMSFILEVNLDQLVISRSNYTILDFLSDVGGI